MKMKEQFERVTEATLDDIKMRDVVGYEGLYAVTSCGQVWSYYDNIFIKQWSNGTPYRLVTLYKNKVKKNKRVHCLVCQAYVENPDPKHLTKVDHQNCNPQDNYVGNLQWADNAINYCNRKSNVSVMDVITCEIYCSMSRAVKSTGVSRYQIVKECEHYRNTGEAKRFVYFKELPREVMNKFIWDYCMRQREGA